MRSAIRPLSFVLVAVLALGACGVYRPDIRQGNYMDDAKTKQIVPGMSREQVQFLLGPPMIADPFHPDRWDYVYTLASSLSGGLPVERRFTIFFDGDKVREVKLAD